MNVAFFGTSDRPIPILEALKDSDYEVKLCVTKDDRKTGRKQITKTTAVKQWAKSNRVQYVTLDKFSGETTRQIENQLLEESVSVSIVADFSYIIPEKIFNLPKYKSINIHFSLLPYYRGASPVQFAILNGDKKTGITYQLIHKKMDMGDILHQIEHKLVGDETSGELYKVLFDMAARNLTDVLDKWTKEKIIPAKQDESKATYTYSPSHPKNTFIYKEDAKIDWNKPAAAIDRMVRAFDPWPIAWATLGEFKGLKKGKNKDLKVKIYKTNVINNKLVIKKIQVEGKKIIGWNEFKNGYLESD